MPSRKSIENFNDTYSVSMPLHKFPTDDLTGIGYSGVHVNSLLEHGVCVTDDDFPSAVL